MSSLSKKDLSEAIHLALGLNKNESQELVECFFKVLVNALESGQQVKLSSFGNFTLRDKEPRIGRNPKTMEETEISARRVVTFRAGNKLKSQIITYQKPYED